MFQTDQVAAQVNSVHAAGDVNGDGYGDLIVGSASYDSGQTDEGVAFVLLGSAAGITSTNPQRFGPAGPTAQRLRHRRHSAAMNGDGFAVIARGLNFRGSAARHLTATPRSPRRASRPTRAARASTRSTARAT
jgi:hypothetical protein